jgi:hypothetical protein
MIKNIRLRRSQSGVPHIVVDTEDDTYSVCWVGSKWNVWQGYATPLNQRIYSQKFAEGDTVDLEDIIIGSKK